MLILADKRIPEKAKAILEKQGNVLYLDSHGITYPSISAHPDIFFCQVNNNLVIASNLPLEYQIKLKELKVQFVEGRIPVGMEYPISAKYNAVVTDNYFIGNTNLIDQRILEFVSEKEIIHVNQGYTRCNLLPLANNRFITSDIGIEKSLIEKGLKVLYVNPKEIKLPGFNHGFIGGAMGRFNEKIFVIGNLNYISEGKRIVDFMKGHEIIELYDGPLFDGGSLIFLE